MSIRNSNLIKKRGVSVVELILATVVLTVGLIPTVSMFINMRKGIEDREMEIHDLLSGQDLIELIKTKKWDEQSPGLNSYTPTKSSIGLDSGESLSNVSQLDDIDDFNGYTDSPMPYLQRTVSVNYVNCPINGAVSDSVSPTDFKKVSVTITRTFPKLKSQTVTTILSNS